MKSPRPMFIAAALAAGLIAAPAPAVAAPADDAGLAASAAAIGFNFGAAPDPGTLDDAAAATLLADNVTMLSTRDELSFAAVQPERGTFDFSRAEAIVDFAAEHGLQVRGHDLITADALPTWVRDGQWNAATLEDALREHVTAVVTHFAERNPGVVTQWDVVGEVLLPDGTLRPSVLQQVLGDEYVRIAFEAARAADPEATLYYDDFYDDVALTQEAATAGLPIVPGANADRSTCDAVPKCVGASTLVASLLGRGAPIDGIGFEERLLSPEPVDLSAFSGWATALELMWAVTEFHVPLPATEIATPEMLQFQADVYRSALASCVGSEACDTFVTWGLTDRLSTVSSESGGVFGGALLFDGEDRPKPAWEAIRSVLDEQVASLPAPAETAPVSDPRAAERIDETADAAVTTSRPDAEDGGTVVPVVVGLGALAAIAGIIVVARRRRAATAG